MSAKQTVTYYCDVCEAELGTTKPGEKLQVTAIKEGEWSMDLDIAWKHFCVTCQVDVQEFFAKMRKRK